MATHIVVSDAQTWLENTKANLASLDLNLEAQISNNVLSRLASTYNDPTFGVPTWIDSSTTPQLVKQIIAMFYAGWFYDRQYSEMVAAEGPSYGTVLRTYAESLIEGLNAGTIELVEIQPNEPDVAPVFYPTDVSSTKQAFWENKDPDNTSMGPAKFSMGHNF
jgi:hypothetical protein